MFDEAENESIGKKITKINFKDDQLYIYFNDGTGINIYDGGQSCCETRYMTCDYSQDEFDSFHSSEFLGIEVLDAPNMSDGYDKHEVQFLKIMTSLGNLVFESHNEHNGWYGGFSIKVIQFNHLKERK